MIITTLGTSHGDHTYCRFNSSTLIESGSHSYLVDAGAPVNGLLIRAGKDICALKAVFITHMHDDHAGGLSGLVKSLIKYPGTDQKTTIYLPEPEAAPGLIAWLTAQHLFIPDGLITFQCIPKISNPIIYDDGILKTTQIPTGHLSRADGSAASFAFSMELEGKKVLFTGDLKEDFSDFPEILTKESYDLCICEATHYDPATALPLLQNCKLKRLVFNHIHDPWHGEGERKLTEQYTTLQYPYEVAHDGDQFII